jgi:hypothetical protein
VKIQAQKSSPFYSVKFVHGPTLGQTPIFFGNVVMLQSVIYMLTKRWQNQVPRIMLDPEQLQQLTVQEILSTVSAYNASTSHQFSLPTQVRRNKSLLVQFIWENADVLLKTFLYQRITGDEELPLSGRVGKRKRTGTAVSNSRKSRRVVHGSEFDEGRNATSAEFMEVVPDEVRRKCHQDFFCATGNAYVTPVVCCVCARENDIEEGPSSFHITPMSEIPNREVLHPRTPHPLHTLHDGMLLDSAGLINPATTSTPLAKICRECWNDLAAKNRKLPPKYSLANDMWIGPIPVELQSLTFPEQMLVALLYPRVYVFKLFPKKVNGNRNAETLQRGMRGNVSTFELDSKGIASMLEGNLMPRLPAILASVITITFVGVGKLPKKWLQNTFRVRRRVVAAALRWFKRNNPKYYGQLEISNERLEGLPEDDVPIELLCVVRETEDVGVVDVEGAVSYVPNEEDGEHVYGSMHPRQLKLDYTDDSETSIQKSRETDDSGNHVSKSEKTLLDKTMYTI